MTNGIIIIDWRRVGAKEYNIKLKQPSNFGHVQLGNYIVSYILQYEGSDFIYTTWYLRYQHLQY